MIKKHLFIGIDVHKKTHTAVFVDWLGNKCGELCFNNKPSAYPDLLAAVKKHLKKGVHPIFGLEDTGNWGRALAVYLTEQKHTVKEVNARLSSERRKSRPIVQKSDSWDSECIAKVLRDEHERLPNIQPIDLFWTINQLVNVRKGLLKNMAAMVNRLHHLLHSHYPSYRAWFASVDGATALAFWETYPSPSCLTGVTLEELTDFLVHWSRGLCTQKKAEQILSDVAKDGDTTTDFQAERDHMIGMVVRNLRFYKKEIAGMEQQLKPLVQSLGLQLETMTGMEFLTACAFVSEIGNVHRFPTPQKLAMYAGIAPVIRASGNKFALRKNPFGNRELHDLFHKLAIKQITVPKGKEQAINPHLHAYFESKMRQGKTRQQAYVCVMRKLANIVYYLMTTKKAYVMPEEPLPQAQ